MVLLRLWGVWIIIYAILNITSKQSFATTIYNNAEQKEKNNPLKKQLKLDLSQVPQGDTFKNRASSLKTLEDVSLDLRGTESSIRDQFIFFNSNSLYSLFSNFYSSLKIELLSDIENNNLELLFESASDNLLESILLKLRDQTGNDTEDLFIDDSNRDRFIGSFYDLYRDIDSLPLQDKPKDEMDKEAVFIKIMMKTLFLRIINKKVGDILSTLIDHLKKLEDSAEKVGNEEIEKTRKKLQLMSHFFKIYAKRTNDFLDKNSLTTEVGRTLLAMGKDAFDRLPPPPPRETDQDIEERSLRQRNKYIKRHQLRIAGGSRHNKRSSFERHSN